MQKKSTLICRRIVYRRNVRTPLQEHASSIKLEFYIYGPVFLVASSWHPRRHTRHWHAQLVADILARKLGVSARMSRGCYIWWCCEETAVVEFKLNRAVRNKLSVSVSWGLTIRWAHDCGTCRRSMASMYAISYILYGKFISFFSFKLPYVEPPEVEP